jgi:hypothetical protein
MRATAETKHLGASTSDEQTIEIAEVLGRWREPDALLAPLKGYYPHGVDGDQEPRRFVEERV